mgnify:CR=1 FL=1
MSDGDGRIHRLLIDDTLQRDGAVPEGRYHVAAKKGRGATKYYKALLLNYPNDADRRAFAASKRDGSETWNTGTSASG